MPDTSTPPDQPAELGPEREDALDRFADRLEGNPAAERLADADLYAVPFGHTMVREMHQVAEDLGAEAQADQRMLDTFASAVREQPPAEAGGIDLAAIRAVDPQFDDAGFRTIARETFEKVRDARSLEDPAEAEALLSPQMQQELRSDLEGDVAAHRHHLLPGLEIQEATIVAAAVEGGRERLDVHFTLAGEEMERDDETAAITWGSDAVHRWQERWRFERDPSVDTSATDEQHVLSFGDRNWMVAHRGWVVTAIERLPG